MKPARNQPPVHPLLTPRSLRALTHTSRAEIARRAHVCVATVRLYETDRLAIVDVTKRVALDREFAGLHHEFIFGTPALSA